ncbi:MAG: 50S ribosomal protein L11 methyltransferase [Bdellovibrionales bacterium]|nr:50S ribosomal protein L11 methyltransferase [Bdellovibrionales bacterium]
MNVNDQQDLALAALEKYLETKSHSALTKFWQLYPRPIPNWHLTMMNDKPRNDFYYGEIKARATDKIVVDLGCGSGLLTQYALEAGAKHIYAIEQDPVLQKCFAFAFREEIKNGRVTLLAKSSQALTVEDFAFGKPELIIHEIFGKALFNERVLETFNDLFSRKVFEETTDFIPQKFSLMACLHEQEKFGSKIKDPKYSEKFWFLEDISYFGVSSSQDKEGQDVSPAFEIFSIDLMTLTDKLESEVTINAANDGNMLRVWFELQGDKNHLSTDVQANPDNHWGNSKFFVRFKQGEVNLKSTYANGKFLTYAKK